MKINYNPPALESLDILGINLNPSLMKMLGIHFEKIKISSDLYRKVYEFYHVNDFFWKSIYNGMYSDPLNASGELKKEEHYGLRFSIVKIKGGDCKHEYWIKQFSERRAHENLRGKYHCNEEQKKKVEDLRGKGDEYYDCFDIVCYLIDNHKKDIIEIEVWDNDENCQEFYFQKALDTPIIFRKSTGAD
ncbi:hypothetical protein [Pantoea sp. At-9b]|uniref:hypothetical protein n=1 Tax=Pantoea sp. (strain At-9b) TaxID=592316 RepID=UPI0001B40211|nr:hypothetical protein [Pantoea sp. At-9b]ADU72664.1 hypothetical protein Pat9b_4695 [Pantoea sp. At-9b]